MKAVQPVRRALGFRTIFNVLGPLTNPAGARAQVMGVYSPHLVPLVAEALAILDVRHALVVHGRNLDASNRDPSNRDPSNRDPSGRDPSGSEAAGLDELTLTGPSDVAEVRGGVVTLTKIVPEDVGLARAPLAALKGGTAQQNAAILMSVFAGEQGPRRDVVLLNAAAALMVGGAAAKLSDGIALAAAAIDSGAVLSLVRSLQSMAG